MQMPSAAELKNCFEDHLPYEIDMLRVAAARLSKVKRRGVDANICIEVFCVHARNLIEFLDERKKVQPGDFKASQFAPGYTCKVDLEDKRVRINKRIAHLTTERVSDPKISAAECLVIYPKLEKEIERFMACLTTERRSDLSARFKVPRQDIVMVANPDAVLQGVTTTSDITTTTVVWSPPHRDESSE